MESSITTLPASTLSALRSPATSRELVGLDPAKGQERLEILDVLRGFALFGVLLSNLELVSHPFLGVDGSSTWLGQSFDPWAMAFLRFAIREKFIVLFTLLFGIGFALQMDRADRRGRSGIPLFRRRMAWLLALGLAHAALLWWGDILAFYAIVGLLLALFHRAGDRALLGLGSTLVVVPALLYSLLVRLLLPPGATPDPGAAIARSERLRERFEALTTGGPPSHLWHENLSVYGDHHDPVKIFFMISSILAFFLLGYFLGRRRLLQRLDLHGPKLRRLLVRWIPFALAGNIALLVTFHPSATALGAQWVLPLHLMAWLGIPALALAYLVGFALLFERASGRWRRGLLLLAPVGRMALSNYLLQSVVYVLLFYRFQLGPIPLGLGWLGQLGTAACIPVAVVVFALQIVFSHGWLGCCQFGPVEWLWRSLTYGRWLPLRHLDPQPVRGS